MKYIEPKAEWWPQSKQGEPFPQSVARHIARVGRLCYKSRGKQPPAGLTQEERAAFCQKRDEERVRGFWRSGHRSMYRHGTAYFFVKNDGRLPGHIWAQLRATPYAGYAAEGHKAWISANMQYLLENESLMRLLDPYGVSEDEFIRKAVKSQCLEALLLLRMTFVLTTQISTARELNRTSPNCIAEQSTRYCNLGRKGGVQVCEPHWMPRATRWQRLVYKAACRVGEWAYLRLLRSGMKPQDARGALPLDTCTVAAYTYTVAEWRHILALRLYGTTGEPHPNAKTAMARVAAVIEARMKEYNPNFDIHEDTVQKAQ